MKLKNIALLLLLLFSSSLYALPTAKITLKVVDEQGQPIEGAKAVIGFTMPVKSGWGSKATGSNGLTDSEGLFSAEGETEPYSVGLGAMKEGYYRSSDKFKKFDEATGFIGMRKWQPWNPTVELVLKEIKDPIPLYAIELVGIEMPELDKFIGFDLVARDWVVPYGQGTHKDFLFKLEGEFRPSPIYVDQTLTLKFPNPGDGIQSVYVDPNVGSQLRLPHQAPVSGYQQELVQRSKSDSKKRYITYKRDDQNFFFRVRTVTDDKGNITSALYGKIHGEISFALGSLRKPERSSLNFTYYLNPKTNDTNLEFDPEKNLFKGLTGREIVREP